MKIQLLYFEGCPSYKHALENLNSVLSEQEMKASVEMINITSLVEAEDLHFLGSPTIQIDGVDLEGADAAKAGVGYGCRVYIEGGQMRGWPSKEHIRSSLSKLIK
ncbi:MAG: hypothetical protein WAQ98_33805 [Blastocatellia bacterium]